MLKNIFMNLLMDAAGDGGSGGGGSLLTSSGQGGGTNVSQGNGGTPDPAGAGGAAAGASGAASGAAGASNTNWRSALGEELSKEPSLQMFNDVSSLAKSYIHAQRTLGADKIPVPGKHATEDDWKQVFAKLGVPADVKDYAVKLAEGNGVDKDFVEKFKATAHAAGILPQQAQKLADWFAEANNGSTAALKTAAKNQADAEIAGLKTEWGQAFDQKVKAAGQVLREAGDDALLQYLDASGLGNNTHLIKLLSSVHDKYFKEGTLVDGGNTSANRLTPNEARASATRILGDMKHPYNMPDHPGHKDAVKEVQSFFEMASKK